MAYLPWALIYSLWARSHLFLADDAFYYLEIAHRVAAGQGSTFDGINPTNGYHPLWLGMLVALATVIRGRFAFVAAALTVQCLLLGFAWWFGLRCLSPVAPSTDSTGAGRRTWIPGLLIIGLVWNFYVSKTMINGFESAVYLLFAVLTLSFFALWVLDERGLHLRRSAALGLLAGATILSRLDSVFLVPAIVSIWAVLHRRNAAREWWRAAFFCVVAGAVLGGYMLFSRAEFGLWMPVSGYIKRTMAVPGFSLRMLAAYCVFVILFLAATRAALGPVRGWLNTPGGVGVCVLSLYLLIYHADSMLLCGWMFLAIWYLPMHVFWVLLLLTHFLNRVSRWNAGFLRRAVIAAVAALLAAGAGLSWWIRLQPDSLDQGYAVRDVADWINQNLPPDAVVAGWDVGTLGYYTDAPVVNLDGLVNSVEYARDYLAKGRTIEFMDRCGVEFVAQYYKHRIEAMHTRGLDADEFIRRAQEVHFSRPVRFASLAEFMNTGRRIVREYRYEVRRFAKPDCIRE